MTCAFASVAVTALHGGEDAQAGPSNAGAAFRPLMPAKKAPAKRAAKKAAPKKSAAKTGAAKNAARPAATPGPDWRDATLDRMRRLIQEAVPDAVEEVKWRKPTNPDGVPVWSSNGILCTGGIFKNYVKITFGKGALLPDPKGVFNAGFGGNSFRAIDLREGDEVDAEAFKELVRAAAALNARGAEGKTKPTRAR
jgi:hypothetical protein